MDAKIITYLLGAGASSDTLPLAADFARELDATADQIQEIEETIANNSSEIKGYKAKRTNTAALIEALHWLAKETADTTVDNFARILFMRQVNGDVVALSSLRKLKAVLTCYFLFKQSIITTDKRYDEFFGKILNPFGGIKMPNNLRILTWNYDYLAEKSYFRYVGDSDRVQKEITISRDFIRLNGLAGTVLWRYTRDDDYHESILVDSVLHFPMNTHRMALYYDLMANQQFDDIDLNTSAERMPSMSAFRIKQIFNKDFGASMFPLLKFAWEKEIVEDSIRDRILGTETLVIIGYSFPDFNTIIDTQLLRTVVPSLKNTFIQAPDKPKGNLSRIKDLVLERSVGSIKSENVKLIDSKGWFYRPSSLIK